LQDEKPRVLQTPLRSHIWQDGELQLQSDFLNGTLPTEILLQIGQEVLKGKEKGQFDLKSLCNLRFACKQTANLYVYEEEHARKEIFSKYNLTPDHHPKFQDAVLQVDHCLNNGTAKTDIDHYYYESPFRSWIVYNELKRNFVPNFQRKGELWERVKEDVGEDDDITVSTPFEKALVNKQTEIKQDIVRELNEKLPSENITEDNLSQHISQAFSDEKRILYVNVSSFIKDFLAREEDSPLHTNLKQLGIIWNTKRDYHILRWRVNSDKLELDRTLQRGNG
jgi:hypothetical protein